MTIGTYTLGPYIKPAIKHDNGFLDQFQKRAPTVSDHLQLQWWVGKLNAAEAAQGVPFLPHNDLSDALAAYRHFLNGQGKERRFSYERYCANDPSGKTTVRNAVADAMQAAWDLCQLRFMGKTEKFSFEMTSSVFAAGGRSSWFPYPQTENWQKAIGAHNFWTHSRVDCDPPSPGMRIQLNMTLYAEDMYNFNPGAADIATGIPDEANGIFEITGLAQQYLNVSELTRYAEWRGKPDISSASITPNDPRRERQPGDNRRLRSRL